MNVRCIIKGYHLLYELLIGVNVTQSKNEKKKASLVRKVKESTSIVIDATLDCDSGSEHTIKLTRKRPKLKWPSLTTLTKKKHITYYYNERKNLFLSFVTYFISFGHNCASHNGHIGNPFFCQVVIWVRLLKRGLHPSPNFSGTTPH